MLSSDCTSCTLTWVYSVLTDVDRGVSVATHFNKRHSVPFWPLTPDGWLGRLACVWHRAEVLCKHVRGFVVYGIKLIGTNTLCSGLSFHCSVPHRTADYTRLCGVWLTSKSTARHFLLLSVHPYCHTLQNLHLKRKFTQKMKTLSSSSSCRSKPVRPPFIFGTQIKIFLMISESFLTLHRQQHNWYVQGPER